MEPAMQSQKAQRGQDRMPVEDGRPHTRMCQGNEGKKEERQKGGHDKEANALLATPLPEEGKNSQEKKEEKKDPFIMDNQGGKSLPCGVFELKRGGMVGQLIEEFK